MTLLDPAALVVTEHVARLRAPNGHAAPSHSSSRRCGVGRLGVEGGGGHVVAEERPEPRVAGPPRDGLGARLRQAPLAVEGGDGHVAGYRRPEHIALGALHVGRGRPADVDGAAVWPPLALALPVACGHWRCDALPHAGVLFRHEADLLGQRMQRVEEIPVHPPKLGIDLQQRPGQLGHAVALDSRDRGACQCAPSLLHPKALPRSDELLGATVERPEARLLRGHAFPQAPPAREVR
mmetsp:Transcript_114137/g.318857  ORF Transcript_114137/g.318857 Transcript_114137/m.318857 type:complete len:237 (+) Transcript_114137:146-856(+)